MGFYADVFADALSLADCESRQEAYSVAEALRMGAARVLDMEREDLEILVVGQPGRQTVDLLLYDPMPGGSGLLRQICERLDEVVAAALDVVGNCPANCEDACIDCLCSFRNAFFHRYLDRHLAVEKLSEWGDTLTFSHEIPPKQPATVAAAGMLTVNDAEELLRGMLERAGFPEPEWHHQLDLGRPLGTTSPDCFFPGDDEDEPGVCLYLDGLSEHIHGNPQTRQQDRQIREQLRALYYEVLEIAASDLHDQEAMRRQFYRLGRLLLGKDRAEEVRSSDWWSPRSVGGEP